LVDEQHGDNAGLENGSRAADHVFVVAWGAAERAVEVKVEGGVVHDAAFEPTGGAAVAESERDLAYGGAAGVGVVADEGDVTASGFDEGASAGIAPAVVCAPDPWKKVRFAPLGTLTSPTMEPLDALLAPICNVPREMRAA
jgi:hypothetical protein